MAEMTIPCYKNSRVTIVEAEFGEETVGVFSKSAVERAKSQYLYSYRELNVWEQEQFKKQGYNLDDIIYFPDYTLRKPAPPAHRVIGVDWDKYANATQIIVTEFDEILKKFRVAKRVEIPRGEFTYDNAVKTIIELNAIWDPKFIYVDAGHGEYQIEMLHLHGRENPETGLDKRVKRVHFSETLEIRDPGTREVTKKDKKNFMINQTSILLDRDQIVLSPFDDMVWKQMMDYQVVRISQSGKPVYTSENEHALDAFMLTILGFTIEFPNITKILEEIKVARKAMPIKSDQMQETIQQKVFGGHRDVFKPTHKKPEREARDNPNWHWNKVSLGYGKKKVSSSPWGRGGGKGSGSSRSKF